MAIIAKMAIALNTGLCSLEGTWRGTARSTSPHASTARWETSSRNLSISTQLRFSTAEFVFFSAPCTYIHDHRPVWKTERMTQAKAHFQELLMKNEQDQNPFHIACKSGEIESGMIVSMVIVEMDFIQNFMCRQLGDGGVSLAERCRCSWGVIKDQCFSSCSH